MVATFMIAWMAGLQEAPLDFDPAARQEPHGSPRSIHVEASVFRWKGRLRGRGAADSFMGDDSLDEIESRHVSFDDDGQLDDRGNIDGFEILLFGLMPETAAPEGLFEKADTQVGMRLLHWRGAWSASGFLTTAQDLGVAVLPAGTPVASEFEIEYYGFDWVCRGTTEMDSHRLVLEGWLGLRLWWASFEMDTPSGEIEDKFGGGGIGLGLRAEMHFWSSFFVSGEASFSGTFGVGAAQGEASAGVEWGGFRVEVGYRQFWAALDALTETVSLTIAGPFAGVEVRF